MDKRNKLSLVSFFSVLFLVFIVYFFIKPTYPLQLIDKPIEKLSVVKCNPEKEECEKETIITDNKQLSTIRSVLNESKAKKSEQRKCATFNDYLLTVYPENDDSYIIGIRLTSCGKGTMFNDKDNAYEYVLSSNNMSELFSLLKKWIIIKHSY